MSAGDDPTRRSFWQTLPAGWLLAGSVLTTLIVSAPIVSVVAAGLIAQYLGCQVDEGSVHACPSYFGDLGNLLYTMGVSGWFMLLTWPLTVIGLFATGCMFVLLLVRAAILRRWATFLLVPILTTIWVQLPDSADRRYSGDQLALVRAASRGDDAAVRRIIARGVDVNARGTRGGAPLFWAAREHNETAFAALVRAGADPNCRDPCYLCEAISTPDIWFLTALLRHGAKPAPGSLEQAVFRVDDAAVVLLLDAGADPNEMDRRGETPLLIALHLHIPKYATALRLLEHGADPNLPDRAGKTAVQLVRDAEPVDPKFKAHHAAREALLQRLEALESAAPRN